MEDAYLLRPRVRCSRNDFAIGFVAALAAFGWRAAFDPQVATPDEPPRAFPLPGLVEALVQAGPNATYVEFIKSHAQPTHLLEDSEPGDVVRGGPPASDPGRPSGEPESTDR
jgi:hypothetical protein